MYISSSVRGCSFFKVTMNFCLESLTTKSQGNKPRKSHLFHENFHFAFYLFPILKSFFGQGLEERFKKIKKIDNEINKNRERINKAIQMMLDGEVYSSEYRAIKSNYENANTTLLRTRASLELDKVDYGSKVNGSFNLLKHIDKFYNKARVDREIAFKLTLLKGFMIHPAIATIFRSIALNFG